MKAIYKSVALLFGAMSLFSSCEDFLTRDPQDSYLLDDFLNTDDKLRDYTRQIYGPLTWNGFDDKFSWCVGELYSGNVYHNFADEGQFHFMSFTANNAHISNGYTSLYSVIAKCNHIINDIPAIAKQNNLSETTLNTVLGEARMFRGLAYFYLAEYWGASPIVLKNSNTVSNDLAPQITKANRKSLYTLIEQDWKEAYKLLPENQQPDCKVWKASASGMLTKLYVTMASCQREIPGEKSSYVCESSSKYYQMAIDEGKKTLNLCDYLEPGASYDKMFQPGYASPEILFALRFEQGVYAQGCSRQIQFARSKHLAGGGNAYGGEKGLTTMLFKSFEDLNDTIRLNATSYYAPKSYSDANTLADANDPAQKGHHYVLNDGSNYFYFLNPNKTLKKGDREKFYGNEPVSAIFNHCRKFVYSIKPLNSEFSIDLTIPILRVADVNLLIAEAMMGQEQKNVAGASTAGNAYIDKVRVRAGLPALGKEGKIAFCEPDEVSYNGDVSKPIDVNDPDGNPVSIQAKCDMYIPTYDLMMERRHEFALENQSWLDIKRLFYRDETAARDYIKHQDRGCIYGEKFGLKGKPQTREDYQRQRLIHDLSVKAHEINDAYAEQASEGVIELDKLQFFLPTPASVPNTATFKSVKDYSDQIKNGKYPY